MTTVVEHAHSQSRQRAGGPTLFSRVDHHERNTLLCHAGIGTARASQLIITRRNATHHRHRRPHLARGKVITGSAASDVDGKPIARVGDKVICPQRGHGQTVIVSGDPTLMVDGAPAALHGDRTSCGAILLSSQVTTYVDQGAGVAALRGSARAVAGAAAEKQTYDLRWHLKNERSGEPLANMPYRITMQGREFLGSTDAEGFTETVLADSALLTNIEAPYSGHGPSTADAHDEPGACGH